MSSSRNINLLPKKNREHVLYEKYLKIYSIFSIVFFILICFFSVSTLFLNKNSSIDSLENEKSVLLKNISANSEKISKYLFVNTRLKDINDVIVKRRYMDQTLDLIIKEIPDGISVNSVKVDKKTLTLTASSTSLQTLNIFIDSLVGIVSENKVFNQIILDGLSLDNKRGYYTLSINLNFI